MHLAIGTLSVLPQKTCLVVCSSAPALQLKYVPNTFLLLLNSLFYNAYKVIMLGELA